MTGWICPRCGRCYNPSVRLCEAPDCLPLSFTVTAFPALQPFPAPSGTTACPMPPLPQVWCGNAPIDGRGGTS